VTLAGEKIFQSVSQFWVLTLGQAKFPDGGSVLASSQFSLLPQLPPKMLLNPKSTQK